MSTLATQKYATRSKTYVDNIWVAHLAQVLDLADSGHIKAILKVADFDLLYSDLPARGGFASWTLFESRWRLYDSHTRTLIYHGEHTLSNLLVLNPK